MQNHFPKHQDIEFLKTKLEGSRIKLTHQRLEIFRQVITSQDHPSAEKIHKQLKLKMPTISLDTVYRTLATFQDLGIVSKLHVLGERTLFDGNTEQHHHFVCSRCKTIQDVFWPDFDRSDLPDIPPAIGEIRSRHLELRGLCNDCLMDENKKETNYEQDR